MRRGDLPYRPHHDALIGHRQGGIFCSLESGAVTRMATFSLENAAGKKAQPFQTFLPRYYVSAHSVQGNNAPDGYGT